MRTSPLRRMHDIALRSLMSREDRRLFRALKSELLPPGHEPSTDLYPTQKIGNAGFDLAVAGQLDLLRQMDAPDLQALFAKLREDPEINPGLPGVDHAGQIQNGFYPSPDAELYAAMILAHRPDTIIEIGSGYSTLIAKAAIDHGGLSSRLHVIDPHPRRSIEAFADRIEYVRVEDSSLTSQSLTPNTLLFIDSSHVCRRGGDLPFLFCRLLPLLPAGVLVHVHDVFLPYDYPDAFVGRFYTEQYLLHCLLACSKHFEVLFATHFMSREHGEAMRAVFGPKVGHDPLFNGASFWFRTC